MLCNAYVKYRQQQGLSICIILKINYIKLCKACAHFAHLILTANLKADQGAKMAEEQDWETTFSPTNSLKEQLNAEQISQNNF